MFQIILEVSSLKPSQSISIIHYSVSDSCTQLGKTIKEVSSILPCRALSFTVKLQCKQYLCRHINSFHFRWCLEKVKEFSFRVTGTPAKETWFCGLKTYKGCLNEVENTYHRKGQWKRKKNTLLFIQISVSCMTDLGRNRVILIIELFLLLFYFFLVNRSLMSL